MLYVSHRVSVLNLLLWRTRYNLVLCHHDAEGFVPSSTLIDILSHESYCVQLEGLIYGIEVKFSAVTLRELNLIISQIVFLRELLARICRH